MIVLVVNRDASRFSRTCAHRHAWPPHISTGHFTLCRDARATCSPGNGSMHSSVWDEHHYPPHWRRSRQPPGECL